MLFSSWTAIGRVLLTGLLGYLALVLMLRVSGAPFVRVLQRSCL